MYALGEGPEALVATDRRLLAFSADREQRAVATVDVGVTAAVSRDETSFVVGYRDGSVDVVATMNDEPFSSNTFEGHPASAVRRLVIGPRDTVMVGFDDGTVGLWSLNDGRRLGHARLHGPIVHVALDQDSLYAASELGDFARWDISAFTRSWCELVRETWQTTPIVWRGGRIERAEPPTSHPCATE